MNEIGDMQNLDSGTDLTKIAFLNTCKWKDLSRIYVINKDSVILAENVDQKFHAEPVGLFP